jgi:type IX secretion system PorP/SprF family membrane protein
MTGSADCYRVGVNGRTQWAGLKGPFNTVSAFIDLNVPDLRSGFGFLMLHDNIGTAELSTNEVSGFYRFNIPVNPMLNINLGLQASYASRNITYDKLIFEDQFTGTVVSRNNTTDPIADFNTNDYLDFSAGILVYGQDTYWLGFAAHHLTEPEQAFYLDESRLPMKLSLHGGYNIYFQKRTSVNHFENTWKISPNFLYKKEAKFDQLDIGVYGMNHNILGGLSYRGILLKEVEGLRNTDAVVLQLGYKKDNISIGYSFDFTVSKLQVKNTKGSHEISMIYTFCAAWPRPPQTLGRKTHSLPCPDFVKSTIRYRKHHKKNPKNPQKGDGINHKPHHDQQH